MTSISSISWAEMEPLNSPVSESTTEGRRGETEGPADDDAHARRIEAAVLVRREVLIAPDLAGLAA